MWRDQHAKRTRSFCGNSGMAVVIILTASVAAPAQNDADVARGVGRGLVGGGKQLGGGRRLGCGSHCKNPCGPWLVALQGRAGRAKYVRNTSYRLCTGT